MSKNTRKGIALLMVFMVLTLPATMLAAENEGSTASVTAAMANGQRDAKTDTNTFLWFAIGCGSGLAFGWMSYYGFAGVLAAYLIEPSVPATRLLGKSHEYIVAYTDAYKQEAKSIQTKNALYGCGTSAAIGLAGCITYIIVLMVFIPRSSY